MYKYMNVHKMMCTQLHIHRYTQTFMCTQYKPLCTYTHIMYEYMYKYKVQEEVYIHEHETIHMNTTNEIIYLIHY